MRESAITFGREHRLVGLLTEPARDASGRAVILLNAGLIHRIGPRRLHVTLARRLAAQGLRVLRMDLSGIGDSDSRKDGRSAVDGVLEDVREAMDALAERCGARTFVLFGICSGAKISFNAALRDARVVGAALVDPGDFGRQAETSPASGDSAFVQHYVRHYWRSVFSKRIDFKRVRGWLLGKVNVRYACKVFATQARGLLQGRREARATRAGLVAEVHALIRRGVRIALLYGEHGASLVFFDMMLRKELASRAFDGRVTMQVLAGTNHDFVTLQSQATLLRAAEAWFRNFEAAAMPAPHALSNGSPPEAPVLAHSGRRSDG